MILEETKDLRPVALSAVLSKMYELIIRVRLYPKVEPLITRAQAGFRRGHSTIHLTLLLTQDIYGAWEDE